MYTNNKYEKSGKNTNLNGSGCNNKSVNAGCYDGKQEISRINFHITLKNICRNSKYGLCVEIYFTPHCGERYLAAIVTKAIDIDEYCKGCKYSECCDEVKVYFNNVVVNVPNCTEGHFDIKVSGNYLSFDECPVWEDEDCSYKEYESHSEIPSFSDEYYCSKEGFEIDKE